MCLLVVLLSVFHIWNKIYNSFFSFQASDGWYWKWLAKWRRKGEEIGVKEQGQLTQQELKVSLITSHKPSS